MLQKFLKVLLLSYSLIFSSFAASTREIGFDIGTLGTQVSTPSNPTSGKNKLYVKDGNLKLLDSTGSEKDIGSGESDNFIPDPGAELVNPTCAAYADTAGVLPVDGTGGSPTVSVAHSATNPLSGKRSLVFTKTAANSQGQGFSCAFTIDNASKGKVLRTQFDYEISSGSYASADAKVFIYDVTNARVIEPSSSVVENSRVKETKFLEWQSSIDSISYRLIIHVTSTSASAYSLKFDSFKTSRGPKVYGSVTTDWQVYTPTFTGFGTPASHRFSWRRVGDSVEIQGTMVTGTTSAVEARISLPSGLVSANSTLFPALQMVGKAGQSGSATTYFGESVLVEPNTAYLTFGRQDSTNTEVVKALGTNIAGTGTTFAMFAKVPIQGWSSSQQLSQDADTRVVSFVGEKTSNQAVTASVTEITMTAIKDTHGAWSGSQYSVKVGGDYSISYTGALGVAGTSSIIVYVNGANKRVISDYDGSTQRSGNIIVENLKAGDVLSFRTATNTTVQGVAGVTSLSISRISGPSQIAASESVVAVYGSSSGQSIPNSTDTIVNFTTKVIDSHNAFNTSTSTYTIPASGSYSVCGRISINPAASGRRFLQIYKNNAGAFPATILDYRASAGASYNTFLTGCHTLPLLTGETIKFSANQDSGGALSLAADSAFNNFSIIRVGNY